MSRYSLKTLLKGQTHVTFLTGAGISTDSGIPDYRGPKGVYMKNPKFKPIQYQEFIQSHKYRQKYWARSFIGWPRILNAIPNQSHFILTKFQKKYPSTTILTQNVDGLHKLSGSTVSEMHGALRNVRCITCNTVTLRQDLQIQLSELNPLFNEWALKNQWKIHLDVAASLNPDGDVDLKWNYDDFIYPPCACGGILKPDVVFFGENMSDSTRDFGYSAIANSSCLVIIGSSLTVYSALRLLKKAQSARVPIYILNNGPTRGDGLATAIIRKNCIDELADLQNLLD